MLPKPSDSGTPWKMVALKQSETDASNDVDLLGLFAIAEFDSFTSGNNNNSTSTSTSTYNMPSNCSDSGAGKKAPTNASKDSKQGNLLDDLFSTPDVCHFVCHFERYVV